MQPRQGVAMWSLISCLLIPATGLAQGREANLQRQDQDAVAQLNRRAREVFREGAELYGEGRFEEALKKFREAFAMADVRRRVFMLVNIAQTLDRLGREEEALRYYEQYLELAPQGPRAAVTRSRARVLRERLAAQREQERQQQELLRQALNRSEGSERPEAGGSGAPLASGDVPAPPSSEKKSWLWVAVGGGLLAVGAGVVALVLLSSGGSENGPGLDGVQVDWDVETLR